MKDKLKSIGSALLGFLLLVAIVVAIGLLIGSAALAELMADRELMKMPSWLSGGG